MQLNTSLSSASAVPALFVLAPGTTAVGPSVQPPGQQGDPFEAMLSSCAREAKSELPSPPPELLDPKLPVPEDPLDLLPANVKAAVKAAEEGVPAPEMSNVTWNGGTLTNAELEIVAALNRHKDLWDLCTTQGLGGLERIKNSPSLPQDLRAAFEGLCQDPGLFQAIHTSLINKDKVISSRLPYFRNVNTGNDLSEFCRHHPQVAAFQEQQEHSYEQNYIPSDGSGNGQPSVMTVNDAMRELYRYSDYLPKNLSLADFKQIVDGNAHTGKSPPQVIAAAQYFLDHPDAWKQLYGGAIDQVHKEDFLQVASSSMGLTRTELNTLDTINKNQGAFFGGGVLTRDKLASMAEDKSLDPKVRQAASQLLSDPLLFALLNNSITGYKTHHKFFDFGGGHRVDSGNISNNDFTNFYRNMSAANRTVQQTKTHIPKTEAEQSAVADMMMGVADQPDIKSVKKNGGALMHAIDDVLIAGSKTLAWAAKKVGVLDSIPVLGQCFGLTSLTLECESAAANLLHTAVNGDNMKQAMKQGLNDAKARLDHMLAAQSKALDWAATAVGTLGFIPGLGELADLASMGLEWEAQAANILHAAISGGDITQALEEAGFSDVAQVVGCIAGPEVKLAMREGLAKELIERAANAGVDLAVSEAQSYAEDYLNNLKEHLEAGPMPAGYAPSQVGTTASSQKVA
ncbi:HrpF/NolX family T3SS translocon protein [Bradyrhizobium sp. CCGUVB4N]|uniref:HrpF/NolX family T3SS translocon protein n=1 Tax=Bradyrhizobium sp. CCGUVB4N TaxID=2949631 RepID=UPI00273A7494|nr:HrpF/NolX family T3SS translocon protein [Bradyrhizobium sp. CCGUVB4N]